MQNETKSMNKDPCVCIGDDRIIGGKKARKFEFPWQVGIGFSGGKNVFCGGALIAKNWVLSAAHCTDGDEPSDLQVFIGANNLKKNKPKAQIIQVAEIIQHENYNTETCKLYTL